MPGISLDEVEAQLIKSVSSIFRNVRDIEAFLNRIGTTQFKEVKHTIPELKKRIKYCKNLMEKKKLQQELNQANKEQKKVKNEISR